MAEIKYGLKAGLLQAVAIQESRLNPWAFRVEPDFFDRYIKGVDKHSLKGIWPQGVSEASERNARATSWGLLQILGQVARELGYVGQYLPQLCDPATGVEWGAMHLANKIKKYGNLADGLSAYNAGQPIDNNRSGYVGPILARLPSSSGSSG